MAALALAVSAEVSAQTAKDRYTTAMEREQEVRSSIDATAAGATTLGDLLTQIKRVVTAYEILVRRFPTSGYADNALWQAASLADAAYQKSLKDEDRARALRFYNWLVREYPASSLVARASRQITALSQARPLTIPAVGGSPVPVASRSPAPTPGTPREPSRTSRATLTSIQRAILADSVRITLELDREVAYYEERLEEPARVFFDLKSVQAAAPLVDKVLSFSDDVVQQIRVGRHPDSTLRIVLDLERVQRYSVFTLYSPFRLVIDCERQRATAAAATTMDRPPARLAAVPEPSALTAPPSSASASSTTTPATSVSTPEPPPVTSPSANAAGGFSMARQLGLGVSRVVIDPGHGGRDPGALGKGLNEANLVLDVALRLEKLLADEPGLEVTLTRRSNVYIPLEERTAIANRLNADLFISIHANASRNTAASGVETYFLSFASSPEAEAVAARENSASEREMHHLPDIIKAIALNNKLDESRDLAGMVQEALATRLRRTNKNLRSLGVKKAPFVVLIGAAMPSVLAEISFVTNPQELQLLKTAAYKERIAEALEAAVLRYRKSLKGSN
ncbi:MAG: N-acetylmuramoyl-L-alanine amidase, partial [Vicinamibacterales bacterium]